MTRNTVIVGILCVIALTCILLMPTSARALLENSLKLEFDHPMKDVDVAPNANGTAIFEGILTASTDYRMDVKMSVAVEGIDIEGWIASISPSAVSVRAGTHQIPVTVSVKAPSEADHRISAVVMIDARGNPWGTGAQPVDADQQLIVNVIPYYGLSVVATTPYKEVRPHSWVTLEFEARNLGNAEIDDLEISVANKNELKDWTVLLPVSSMTIEKDQILSVPVTLETPRDWTLWSDEVQEITIKLHSDSTNITETYSAYVRRRGTYIPGFDPAFTIACLCIVAIMLRRLKK